MFCYLLHHSFNVLHHVVVPESQNDETLSAQPSIALFIVLLLLSMLSAINLDNQSPLQTHEIDDLPAQRLLTAEFTTLDLPVAKPLPK